MKKILIIQTAFIGDVILATPVIERLHTEYPTAKIDFLLRKGNEGLLHAHPKLNELLIWNKKEGKYKSLRKLIGQVRQNQYDLVVNLHRFMSSGIITARSKARIKVGFDKNPMSLFYTYKAHHHIARAGGPVVHEVERNLAVIEPIVGKSEPIRPQLYPNKVHVDKIEIRNQPFVCMAPTSVWFTKQWPHSKWVELSNMLTNKAIYLLGAPSDQEACEKIIQESEHPNMTNMAGKLNFLESAALMARAEMNYTNDSAPMHMASAMNAPVTAIFCSTIPEFGFGPLSAKARTAQVAVGLSCRPCGLHGYKSCPQEHFKCADINLKQLLYEG